MFEILAIFTVTLSRKERKMLTNVSFQNGFRNLQGPSI